MLNETDIILTKYNGNLDLICDTPGKILHYFIFILRCLCRFHYVPYFIQSNTKSVIVAKMVKLIDCDILFLNIKLAQNIDKNGA